MYDKKYLDDNATACRFPARLHWLKDKLDLQDLPEVTCKSYDEIVQRLDPTSTTMVFPAAHINSPASMFGHTFLRINSSYNSKLLSYAINYAASVDSTKENGVVFAIKGLMGGYYGRYSLLPYYDKLKEYRDSEARDIWEYDLNLTQQETMRMVEHIWELNNTYSYYYFFTQNCSYNMLWLLEIARPSLHLREKFSYQVIPLETVHAIEEENIVTAKNYRPSKRTQLLEYESLLQPKAQDEVLEIVDKNASIEKPINDKNISLEQKQYILEACLEFLEYRYMAGKLSKEIYTARFHEISTARAKLGQGKALNIVPDSNPDSGNRAIKSSISQGYRDGVSSEFIGIRPAYHTIDESAVGFLRGTQIEFLDLEAQYSQQQFTLEKATLLSIVSMAQRTKFFDNLSWRMKTGFDKNFYDAKSHYLLTVGAGSSWGWKDGYVYIMADPLMYADTMRSYGIGASTGLILDHSKKYNTATEITHRWYGNEKNQWLFDLIENYRINKKFSLQFEYKYHQRISTDENFYKVSLNYFF